MPWADCSLAFQAVGRHPSSSPDVWRNKGRVIIKEKRIVINEVFRSIMFNFAEK
jgi:hypothetical protein